MERSLGDAPEEEKPDPTTFDVAAFAAGHRPGRRSVQVRTRLDLYPDLEDIVRRIDAADPDSNIDHLIDEFDAVKARMLVTFVFEQRSREWVREFYKRAAKALGVTGKSGGGKGALKGEMSEEQAREITFRLLAAQCVQPEDVTPDTFRDLYEVDPAQVDELALAVQQVNARESEALTLDFSQRRSTNRTTRRT